MSTKHSKDIVIVLTNKGYVAIENNQIFDLWKNKSLLDIHQELSNRYPGYTIHLGSWDLFNYRDAVEVAGDYLINLPTSSIAKEKETINNKFTNTLKLSIMKRSTYNIETAKVLSKVAADISTRKLMGALHFTLQSTADIVQLGADITALGEGYLREKINCVNEGKTEIADIRKEHTKVYQEFVKSLPSELKEKSIQMAKQLQSLHIVKPNFK